MTVLGFDPKNFSILFALLTLTVLVRPREAAVDFNACITPCVLAFTNAVMSAFSDEQLCNATEALIKCTALSCEFKERNIPPAFYDYLQSLYEQKGLSYDNCTAEREYVPIGVDQLLSVFKEVFSVLFKRCDNFENCLLMNMTAMWGSGETHPCIINSALKTCIYATCHATSPSVSIEAIEESRDNLINVFFRKMEERGFGCDKEGLRSWTTPGPDTTTTPTTTTTTPQTEKQGTEYPACSEVINFCDRTFRPAVVQCKVQYAYHQCVVEGCGFRDQKLPTFLLRKLELDSHEMGYGCRLVSPTNKATDWNSPCFALIASLATVLVALFIM